MKGLEAFRNKSVYLGGKSVKILLTLDEHENIEKELKALEIIRKKKVDTRLLEDICNNTYGTYNAEYEEMHGSGFDKQLTTEDNNYITKEEYDLLKEVLNNEQLPNI